MIQALPVEALPTCPEGKPLWPTQTCFDDALDFITFQISSLKLTLATCPFILVHGVVTYAGLGPFPHAWVEEPNKRAPGEALVWQGAYRNGVPPRIFYPMRFAEFSRLYQVHKRIAYTCVEADKLNEKHLNFGPWDEELRAMALNDQPKMSIVQ